jgi:hypothetical protein
MRVCIPLAVRLALALPCTFWLGACTTTKHLMFSTATKFGLDIAQRADQTVDVSMGYDRAESASIPVPEDDDLDASEKSDSYSVLGAFRVRYDTPWGKEPLELDQFFATGLAARKAARTPEFGRFFGREAGCIAGKSAGSDKCGQAGDANAEANTGTTGAAQ